MEIANSVPGPVLALYVNRNTIWTMGSVRYVVRSYPIVLHALMRMFVLPVPVRSLLCIKDNANYVVNQFNTVWLVMAALNASTAVMDTTWIVTIIDARFVALQCHNVSNVFRIQHVLHVHKGITSLIISANHALATFPTV